MWAAQQIGRDYATQLNGKIVLDTCNAGPGIFDLTLVILA
jgi:hypothetical protein